MKGLFVLLSLMAFASCSPTLGLINGLLGGGANSGGAVKGVGGIADGYSGGAVGGLPKTGGLGGVIPGGRTDRGFKQEGGVYPVGGGGLFQVLGFLGQGLTDVTGNAGSILNDLVHLRIPGLLDDALNAVISVGRACGGIVNALIPGLGTLLGNLIVSIGKIAICLLGSPGLTGSLLGDRRPGNDNPRDIPYICGPQYGSSWGCAYEGPYSNPDSIISHYGVKDALRQAQEFIDKYTNGAGVDSLTGSPKIISLHILAIAKIMDKGSKNWTDDDIISVVIDVVTISAVIGESYQSGLGIRIVDEWIAYLNKNNKNQKFPDISKYRSDIIQELKETKEDKWGGAFDQSKRSELEKIKNTQTDKQEDKNIDTSDNETGNTENDVNADNSENTDSDGSNN